MADSGPLFGHQLAGTPIDVGSDVSRNTTHATLSVCTCPSLFGVSEIKQKKLNKSTTRTDLTKRHGYSCGSLARISASEGWSKS
jgi:hypothetical protein